MYLSDYLLNNWLYIRSYILKYLNHVGGIEEPIYDKDFNGEIIFEEDFKSLDFNKWRIGHPWGIFHPDYNYQYYGEDTVFIDKNCLNLGIKYNPKLLNHYLLNYDILVPYSVGLISSKEAFTYGFFEFKVILPSGPYLWPAIWLTGLDTWPPEIDLLEGYTNAYGNYNNRLESNIHYNIYPNNKEVGARSHSLNEEEVKERILKVSCHWTEKFIKIYYNGFLVRIISDPNVLKYFKDVKMYIVLNNALRPEFINYIKENKINQLEFLEKCILKVYNVKVWKIK